jgi:hypothetical protein
MAQEDWAEEKKLGAASTHYADAVKGQSKATAVTDTTGSSATGGATSAAGAAPNYATGQAGHDGGAKGKSNTEGFEGGKDAGAEGMVGGKMDPGRLAEEKFAKDNARTEFGTVPKQKGGTGGNEFEVLGGDSSA